MAHVNDVLSDRTVHKCTRLREAKCGTTVCQFCAVGCSQLAFYKDKELIEVEGDPRSPINAGRQCPKGMSTFMLNRNPYRETRALYRAPGASEWEEKSIDWMLDAIADRIWETRNKGFVEKDENGLTINAATNIGFIGGSALDNEECYLIRKLFTGGLGILPTENSARYCHSTTVAALSPTFGFGACTNPPRDLINSDCILIMGSNMGEAHPVAFHWPMEAKRKGAITIHADPRFTRTSAACDHYVHTRPGADIAFIGGLINYVLEHDYWFKEYVINYTNAATLIDPGFEFDDVRGFFNGWDPETNSYSQAGTTWDYQYEMNPDGSYGQPKQDLTLQDPHCVFQLIKKQFSYYTPEVVADICGCRPADIVKVGELIGRNSGRDRTTAFCYATGFTQHSSGSQIIRTAAILQLLLGNIGRPGGGILALRGHSNVQGATDVPTLFNVLPNYIPQPEAHPGNATLADYLANGHGFSGALDKTSDGMWKLETERGSWASLPNYMVSLLKAYYGENATKDNEYGYQWLPKLSDNESLTVSMEKALRGGMDGMVVIGQNIAVTNPNTGWSRDAMRNLEWLVVMDLFENESASVWYADPKGPSPDECQTEVFYLPVCTCLEKEGSVTNTERVLQWHERIQEAPGAAHADSWYIYQLGKRLQAKANATTDERDAGMRALYWDYDANGPTRSEREFELTPIEGDLDMMKVVREMNGFNIDDGSVCQGSGTLKDDGSTVCGCRLLSGILGPEGENLMNRTETGDVHNGSIFSDYRVSWPENSRILYNRCSADPEGKPWSERKKLIWWDEQLEQWVGYDKPQCNAKKPPTYQPEPGATGDAALAGDCPFGAHSDGKAWLFVPYSIKEGPMPVYYETTESPYENKLWEQTRDPGLVIVDDVENPIAPVGEHDYPTIMTTYHVTEHWLSGAQTRTMPWLVGLQPERFLELSPEQAASIGVETGDYVTVESERAKLQIRALVTPRLRIGEVYGQKATVVGAFVASGYKGLMVSDITNDLSPAIMASDGLIPASKGFAVRITKADPNDLQKLDPYPLEYDPLFDKPIPDTPWPAQPEGRN